MTRNGEYIHQVMSGQGETLDSLTSMIDVLGDKLKGSSSACMDLVEKLSALDSLIDDEKRKWIVQVRFLLRLAAARATLLTGRSCVSFTLLSVSLLSRLRRVQNDTEKTAGILR